MEVWCVLSKVSKLSRVGRVGSARLAAEDESEITNPTLSTLLRDSSEYSYMYSVLVQRYWARQSVIEPFRLQI